MPNGDVQQSDPGKWQRILRLLSQGGARWAAAFGHPQALEMEQMRDQQRKQAEQEVYQRAIQRRAETRAESRESRAVGLHGLRQQGLKQGLRRGQRLYDVAPKTREEALQYKREEAEIGQQPVTGPGGTMYRMEGGRMVPVQRSVTTPEIFEEMRQGEGGFRPIDVPFQIPGKAADVPNTYWEALLAKHKGDFAAALAEDLERKTGLRRVSKTVEAKEASASQRRIAVTGYFDDIQKSIRDFQKQYMSPHPVFKRSLWDDPDVRPRAAKELVAALRRNAASFSSVWGELSPDDFKQGRVPLDEEMARLILLAVNGDREKARAVAKQIGFQF